MINLILKKRFSLLCAVFVLIALTTINTSSLFAQTGGDEARTITGKVLEGGTQFGIPGVNILIKGTTRGIVSDIDGNYSINASDNETLVFSYIGFIKQEVLVGTKSIINITLMPDNRELDELVVVGYGVQKKSHVTGSVAKMGNNEYLAKMPVSGVGQVMKGQLAGVIVQSTNAEAGAAPKITIRGVSSVNSSSSPLLVVDGYPTPGDLSTINMNDVESIEILKDAASAAIYGSRGSNGVILVTTRKGVAGKPKFNFSVSTGFKQAYKKPNLYPTPTEWTDYVNNDASDPTLIPDQIAAMNALGTYTNYEDIILNSGTMQNYSLGASGGNDKVRYYLSGGYMKDDGIILTNNYERFNLNLNVDANINSWMEAGLNIRPSYSNQQTIALGLHDALRNQPWLPQFHTEETVGYAHAAGYSDVQVGDYAHERHFSDIDGTKLQLTSNNNAVAKVAGKDQFYDNYQVAASTFLRFKLAEGLHLKTSLGTFARYSDSQFYQAAWSHRKAENYGTYSSGLTTDILNENTLNYVKTKGDHFINLLGGFTVQDIKTRNLALETSEYLTDKITTLNAGTIIDEAYTNKSESYLVSTLYRAAYAFKNTYMLNAAVRWDGSSRFGENNKWGFFPSISAGWNIANEKFMQNQSTFSKMKLRLSYGATGNNSIGDYAALALLEPTANGIFGSGIQQGFTQLNIANPNLSWERTFEFDAGIDFGILEDKYVFAIDFYNKKTDQLLLNRDIPSVTGFTNVWSNMGEVQNQGIEFEFLGHLINQKNLKWDLSLNLAHNQNKLLDFGGPEEVISTPDSKRPSQFIAEVGSPLVQFYGYVVDYEVSTSDMTSPYWPVNVDAANVYVKDMNGDGVITTADRVPLGNPYPDFVWGINNTFKVGNFDFYMLWQGAQGASIYNIDSYYYGSQWKGSNVSTIENADFLQSKVVTDWNVQDASYTSLRNISIGYTTPKSWFNGKSIDGLRLFVTAQNLLYLTSADYTGMNPEGVNLYDETLTYGYQRGAAPIAKSFVIGLDLNF